MDKIPWDAQTNRSGIHPILEIQYGCGWWVGALTWKKKAHYHWGKIGTLGTPIKLGCERLQPSVVIIWEELNIKILCPLHIFHSFAKIMWLKICLQRFAEALFDVKNANSRPVRSEKTRAKGISVLIVP